MAGYSPEDEAWSIRPCFFLSPSQPVIVNCDLKNRIHIGGCYLVQIAKVLGMTEVKAHFRMQDAAPTIVITGPSGSGKSYTLTVALPESSNRLLARNVGMKQTTLINTKIMLF